MIFKKSNNDFHIRLAPLFGDSDILLSIYHSKFWEYVFIKDKSATFLVGRELLRLFVEMFAYSVRVFLRIKYGKRTTGVILTLLTILLIITFNSIHFEYYLAPVALLLAPFMYFFVDTTEPLGLVFNEVHSYNLLGFLYAFTIWSILQLMAMYLLGWKNKKDTTKRGDSLIYLLLKNHIKIQETFIQNLIEPILIAAIGFYFWEEEEDVICLLYFSISAICLMIQERLDSAFKDTLNKGS